MSKKLERKLLLILKEKPDFIITAASLAAELNIGFKKAKDLIAQWESEGILHTIDNPNLTIDGIRITDSYNFVGSASLKYSNIKKSWLSNFISKWPLLFGILTVMFAGLLVTGGILHGVIQYKKTKSALYIEQQIEIKRATLDEQLKVYEKQDVLRDRLQNCAFQGFNVKWLEGHKLIYGPFEELKQNLDDCLLSKQLQQEEKETTQPAN